MDFTASSRGLKSVCKFKICKNFAKFLHRRKIFFAHFAKFLHILQKKKGTRGHQSLILQPLLEKKRLTKEMGTHLQIQN